MEAGKIHQCFECPDGVQIFATQEALLTHKWDMIRTSKLKSHMLCHICKLDHRTFEGLVRHYQLQHPVEQKLACPGCQAPFVRLHILMNHLDSDACPNILANRVGENRILHVQATNLMVAAAASASASRDGDGGDDLASQTERLGIFDVSGVTVGDFGRFVGIDPGTAAAVAAAKAGLEASPGSAHPGRRAASTSAQAVEEMIQRQRQLGVGGVVDQDRQEKQPKAVDKRDSPPTAASAAALSRAMREFRRGDVKGPDFLTDDMSPGSRRNRGLGVWSGQSMLMPVAEQPGGEGYEGDARLTRGVPTPPAASTTRAAPSVNGLAAHRGGGPPPAPAPPTPASPPGVDHPDHPRFNIYKYKHKITGRFSCPHDMCRRQGKQFKTSTGLVMHLRSDTAHSTLRVQCPSCFSFFTSVHALTQHCESASSRCQFRESEEYLPFLNILTAGVADVKGRNIDMTLAYSVQPTAAQELLQDEVHQGDKSVGYW